MISGGLGDLGVCECRTAEGQCWSSSQFTWLRHTRPHVCFLPLSRSDQLIYRTEASRRVACALSSDEQPLRLGLRDGGLSWPAIDVRQWMRGGSRKALRNTQLAVWSQKSKER